MSDLWVTASADAESEHLHRHVTAARVAAASVWPFLAASSDEQDYANRKALSAERIERIASAVAEGDPALFGVVHAAVLDGFDQDFTVLHSERLAKATEERIKTEATRRKEADLRARIEAETLRRVLAAEVPPEFKEQQKKKGDGESSDSDEMPDFIKDKIENDKKSSRRTAASEDIVTCGTCGLSWDDSISTSMTPAPSARCPFEYFHEDDAELDPSDIPSDHPVQPKTATRRTAGVYCNTHSVWVGDGNSDTHEGCSKEQKATEKTKDASRRVAYYTEGEQAKCHKDGKPIEFFDGAWYHLNSDPAPENHNDVHPPNKSERNEVNSSKTAALPEGAGARDFAPDQTVAQIGRMNILAISGGRVNPIFDGSRVVGISLPVSQGYSVDVYLGNDDTYIVQRVYRGTVKGEQRGVYADEVGEAAYQAHAYQSNPFGGHEASRRTAGASDEFYITTGMEGYGGKIVSGPHTYKEAKALLMASTEPVSLMQGSHPLLPKEPKTARRRTAGNRPGDACPGRDSTPGAPHDFKSNDICVFCQQRKDTSAKESVKTAGENPFATKKPADNADAGAPDAPEGDISTWACPNCQATDAYTQGGKELAEALKASEPIKCGSCQQVDQSGGLADPNAQAPVPGQPAAPTTASRRSRRSSRRPFGSRTASGSAATKALVKDFLTNRYLKMDYPGNAEMVQCILDNADLANLDAQGERYNGMNPGDPEFDMDGVEFAISALVEAGHGSKHNPDCPDNPNRTAARRQAGSTAWDYGLDPTRGDGQVYSCGKSMTCNVTGNAAAMEAHYKADHTPVSEESLDAVDQKIEQTLQREFPERGGAQASRRTAKGQATCNSCGNTFGMPGTGGMERCPKCQSSDLKRTAANPYEPVSNPYTNDPPVVPGTPDDHLDGPRDVTPLTTMQAPTTTRPRQAPSGAPAENTTRAPQGVQQGFASLKTLAYAVGDLIQATQNTSQGDDRVSKGDIWEVTEVEGDRIWAKKPGSRGDATYIAPDAWKKV